MELNPFSCKISDLFPLYGSEIDQILVDNRSVRCSNLLFLTQMCHREEKQRFTLDCSWFRYWFHLVLVQWLIIVQDTSGILIISGFGTDGLMLCFWGGRVISAWNEVKGREMENLRGGTERNRWNPRELTHFIGFIESEEVEMLARSVPKSARCMETGARMEIRKENGMFFFFLNSYNKTCDFYKKYINKSLSLWFRAKAHPNSQHIVIVFF